MPQTWGEPGENLGFHTNPKPNSETWVRGDLTRVYEQTVILLYDYGF